MAYLQKKGDKRKFNVTDAKCIGRDCFQPGMYQHRGATLSGSRNTGSPDSPCCMRRAYHGCPIGPVGPVGEERRVVNGKEEIVAGLPEINPELEKQRKADGWKAHGL
jgi:hypothetical protein